MVTVMNNEVFDQLDSKELWETYSKLIEIKLSVSVADEVNPGIIEMIIEISRLQGLDYYRDDYNNLIVSLSPSEGLENNLPLCIQTSLNSIFMGGDFLPVDFSFNKEGMLVAKQGRINSNYINVSMMLNLISNKSIEHGPIELVFTSDIKSFELGSLPKRIVTLNRSPKDFIYFGGAGKSYFEAETNIQTVELENPEEWVYYRLSIDGFTGGQSIQSGYANAVKVAAEIFSRLPIEILFGDFCGGSNHDFIPNHASVLFFVRKKDNDIFKRVFNTAKTNILLTYSDEDPNFVLQELRPIQHPRVFQASFQKNFLDLLRSTPHGVDSYNKSKAIIPDTSVNLGCVDIEKSRLKISGNYCFNSDAQKAHLEKKLSEILKSHGIEYIFSDIYLPWIPKEEHEFFHLVCKTYTDMFNRNLRMTSSHRSLDANVIAEKRPDSEIVVFGPVIENVYTDNECIDTDSVKKTWQFLLELLKN
jgi:dipeptidase D